MEKSPLLKALRYLSILYIVFVVIAYSVDLPVLVHSFNSLYCIPHTYFELNESAKYEFLSILYIVFHYTGWKM